MPYMAHMTPLQMEFMATKAWMGVTAENQKRADERIPELLKVPAAVRFVSIEPMLEGINLDKKYRKRWNDQEQAHEMSWMLQCLDWVICGAETGPGKREMKEEWAIDLRDQCREAGVPFFFKKNSQGGWELAGDVIEEYPAEQEKS